MRAQVVWVEAVGMDEHVALEAQGWVQDVAGANVARVWLALWRTRGSALRLSLLAEQAQVTRRTLRNALVLLHSHGFVAAERMDANEFRVALRVPEKWATSSVTRSMLGPHGNGTLVELDTKDLDIKDIDIKDRSVPAVVDQRQPTLFPETVETVVGVRRSYGVPPEVTLTPEYQRVATDLGLTEPGVVWDHFTAWWANNPKSRQVVNWKAAWRNWCHNEVRRFGNRAAERSGGVPTGLMDRFFRRR